MIFVNPLNCVISKNLKCKVKSPQYMAYYLMTNIVQAVKKYYKIKIDSRDLKRHFCVVF